MWFIQKASIRMDSYFDKFNPIVA